MTATIAGPGFVPAVKLPTYPRIAVVGTSGSGKLPAALALAQGHVGVIDTTSTGAASRYADVVDYRTLTVASGDLRELTYTLAVAAEENITTLIIYSLSTMWSGPGGMLEAVDLACAAAGGRDKNAGWSVMRPHERAMWAALAAYPGTVLAVVRQKTDWAVDRDPDTGRIGARAVGLRPDQADNFADHFGHVLLLDAGTAVVAKSPVPDLAGQVIRHPGVDLAVQIDEWHAKGAVGERIDPVLVRDWALREDRAADELRSKFLELTGYTHTAGAIPTRNQGGALVLLDAPIIKRLRLDDAQVVPGVVPIGPLLWRRAVELRHSASPTPAPVNPGIDGAA
jgi:hypothetical protein